MICSEKFSSIPVEFLTTPYCALSSHLGFASVNVIEMVKLKLALCLIT
jgi:hypothetical protein